LPHGPDKKKRADFSRVQSGSSSSAPAAGWFNTQLTQSFQGNLASRPDATSAPGPRPKVDGETTRGLRNLLAGLAESVDRIPADAVSMLGGLLTSDAPAITGGGRGGSPARSAPQLESLANRLKPGADALAEAGTRSSTALGDFIAGETREEAGGFGGSREVGDLLGMVAGPEALVAGVRALRPTNPLIRRLLEPGGATLTPKGEAFAGSGYAVADPKLIGSFRTPREAERFLSRADVKRALAEGRHIGKWTDPVSGVTEINITDLFPDQKEALKVAARRGEQAIGDIQAGEYAGDIVNPHAPVREAKALVEQMNGGRMLPRAEAVPADRGRQLAETYEALPKVDPNARPAYEALNREIEQQYKAITDAGYKIEFTDADPYRNSAEMMADIRDNKTLKVFKTPGEGAHPFMSSEQNDRFRAVHDFIAHGGGGNQFGALGEENAYRIHASTLSPEAKRALATETRGQNSWVNYGPNSHLPAGERPFAEQKAALWPEGLLDDYDTMPVGEAEKVIGRDATGNAYTNRGNVVREPAPLPALLDSESERALIRDKHGNIYTNRDRTIDGPRAPELDEVGLPANPQGRFAQPWGEERRGGLLANEAGAVGDRPEHVVGAAFRNREGELFSGMDHGTAYSDAWTKGKAKTIPDVWESGDHAARFRAEQGLEEGFVTSTGRFVTRDEAAEVARQARQVGGRDAVDFGKNYRYGGTEAGNSGTRIMGGMTVGGALGGAAGAELSDDPNAALLGLAAGMVGGAGLGMAGGRATARAAGLLDNEAGAIRAYHGGAGNIDRFDLSKVGSGEGASAYGHGLYFSELEDTGKLFAGRAPGNALYKVDLDVEPTDLIDWEAPLSQQSPKVREILEPMFRRAPEPYSDRYIDATGTLLGADPTGSDIVQALRREARGQVSSRAGAREASSARLREAGIPGVRYPAKRGGSTADGPSNYVMFDDSRISIVDREPGLLGNERGAIGWQPTSRGVFDRNSSTVLQGQAQIDPRLEARMPRGEASELSQAVADSRVVREGLRSDMEAGLPLGGDIWYEHGPVQDVLGEEGLRRFNLARGSGSIQNPTHNELATASGLLFGDAQGLGSMADIRAAHREMYPREAKLWGSEGTFTNYRNALEAGAQLPATPGSAERKVPWYTHGLEGGSLTGGVALDTHERRRLTQLAATDKKVKKLLKQLGITDVTGVRAEPLPITNALDYELLSEPYRRLAQEMGLPSAQAAQAGRWIGGGKFTGLKSQPMGDAMQTLEDGLLHTSMTRGLPTDPASLSKLFERLATGQDIATPVYGKDPFAALYSGQGLLGF
jgi:hypothetical protein